MKSKLLTLFENYVSWSVRLTIVQNGQMFTQLTKKSLKKKYFGEPEPIDLSDWDQSLQQYCFLWSAMLYYIYPSYWGLCLFSQVYQGSSWIRQATKIKNFTPSGDVITKLKYNCKNSSTC